MADPGFKKRQLGSIRQETAYPSLRQYIATIRFTAKLLIGLIIAMMLLGIGLAWLLWVVRPSGGQAPDVFGATAATITIVLVGTVVIVVLAVVTRLLSELYELVVDAGDSLVDVATSMRHLEQYGFRTEPHGHAKHEPPASFVADPPEAAIPVDPPQPATPVAVTPAAKTRTERPTTATADALAADNLLQLAQRHSRNGNKPEAVRCLRAIVDRYPNTDAADTARRFVERSRR